MSSYPLVRVVGMHFRGSHAKEYAAQLLPGFNELTLEREPKNPHDPYAIKVLAPGEPPWHLGYIERGAASFIALDLDSGDEFRVTVEDILEEKRNFIPRVNLERR